jgi:hypothetical protein
LPLLWFHAFDREAPADIVEVLLQGPLPSAGAVDSATATAETRLGIPSSVYAYLGNANDQFGRNLIAMNSDAFVGVASPFDTGGCVKVLEPLRGWTPEEQTSYVSSYSFPTASLLYRLPSHPGNAPGPLVSYLSGRRPHALQGPHELWKGPKAPLWANATDWRGWTWEGRQPGQLPTGGRIALWTCETTTHQKLLEVVAGQPALHAPFEELGKRYVHGGFSKLLAQARAQQVAP